ncbi:hypothetical protein [Streptomyces sp. NPDC017520]|uniref:hypothetical protein n=1 Tax=Streptomyces sp. NPDC017520 TaxID=3364998 RepID=UPI003788F098
MDPGDGPSTRGYALTDGLSPPFAPTPVEGDAGTGASRTREELRSLAGAQDLLVTHPESLRPFGSPLGTATVRSTA